MKTKNQVDNKTIILSVIIFIAIFFLSLSMNAQQQQEQRAEPVTNIGDIKIRSKIELTYDSRVQKKDTIYITISKWLLNPITGVSIAKVTDYVKSKGKYFVISEKAIDFSKQKVDNLFSSLNNSILPSESYTSELSKLLSNSLLLDTKNNLLEGGKTVYGGVPNNWETFTE